MQERALFTCTTVARILSDAIYLKKLSLWITIKIEFINLNRTEILNYILSPLFLVSQMITLWHTKKWKRFYHRLDLSRCPAAAANCQQQMSHAARPLRRIFGKSQLFKYSAVDEQNETASSVRRAMCAVLYCPPEQKKKKGCGLLTRTPTVCASPHNGHRSIEYKMISELGASPRHSQYLRSTATDRQYDLWVDGN